MPVAAFARRHALPLIEVPYGIRDLGAWWSEASAAARDTCGRTAWDVGVVVSFGYFIPPAILGALARGAINVHPSALPRHRGAAPVPATILAGDAHTAVSVIEIHASRFDAGRVLLARPVAVEPYEMAPSLLGRLADVGATAALDTLADLDALRARAGPQDEALATRAPKLKPEDGLIDWSRDDAACVLRKLRAFAGSIGIFGLIKTAAEPIRIAGNLGNGSSPGTGSGASAQAPPPRRVALLALAHADKEADAALRALPQTPLTPGRIAFDAKTRCLFVLAACGGWLRLDKLCVESRAPVTGTAFAAGLRLSRPPRPREGDGRGCSSASTQAEDFFVTGWTL